MGSTLHYDDKREAQLKERPQSRTIENTKYLTGSHSAETFSNVSTKLHKHIDSLLKADICHDKNTRLFLFLHKQAYKKKLNSKPQSGNQRLK